MIFLSIYPSSTYLSVHPSIHPPIHSSIYLPIHPPSIYPFTHLSNHLPVHPSSIQLSTHLPNHLPTISIIHPLPIHPCLRRALDQIENDTQCPNRQGLFEVMVPCPSGMSDKDKKFKEEIRPYIMTEDTQVHECRTTVEERLTGKRGERSIRGGLYDRSREIKEARGKDSFHQRSNSGPRLKNCKSPRGYSGKFKPRCRKLEVTLHYDLLLQKEPPHAPERSWEKALPQAVPALPMEPGLGVGGGN